MTWSIEKLIDKCIWPFAFIISEVRQSMKEPPRLEAFMPAEAISESNFNELIKIAVSTGIPTLEGIPMFKYTPIGDSEEQRLCLTKEELASMFTTVAGKTLGISAEEIVDFVRDNLPEYLVATSLLFDKEENIVTTSFVDTYNATAESINETAKDKGWWEEARNDGEIIALMHSELSEALEALRHGNPPDNHIPEFSGVEAEMADVIIRIMDFGFARGHRVAEALEAKVAYNNTRSYMHGGKKF